jgi:hypothetical protein
MVEPRAWKGLDAASYEEIGVNTKSTHKHLTRKTGKVRQRGQPKRPTEYRTCTVESIRTSTEMIQVRKVTREPGINGCVYGYSVSEILGCGQGVARLEASLPW